LIVIDISKLGAQQLESFIHMQSIVARQKDAADRILALRDYYDGEHPVLLTERQQQYLGDLLSDQEFTFAHNIVRSVIDTLRERLAVTGIGIEGTSEEDTNTPEAIVSRAMWEWWTKSRLDSGQIRLYRRALRDGKAYVLVDFDNEKQRPRFTSHHVDAGDREPGIMLYRDPSDLDTVLMAIRHFVPDNPINPAEVGRERKTIYLPDQVRKYVMGKGGQWEPYMEPGDTSWPLPWVDRRGRPLGVLAIEFENPGGSEVEQIIGLQNALNKTWLDLIAAADTSGFPIPWVAYEEDIPLDTQSDADGVGTDEIRLSPGRLLEVVKAKVGRLEAADLMPIIAVIDRIEQAISGVSRTPSYYLKPVGGSDVPSGEALKQLESGLVRRAEERQLVFGQAWQDVFALAYRVNQAYGPSLPELEEPSISVTWADANVRNELAEAQTAEAHQRLGVPQATLWREIGYTPEEIDEFKRSQLADTNAKVAGIAAMLRTDQSRQGGQQQPAQNGAAVRNGTGVQG
jgi:hypothetical protein